MNGLIIAYTRLSSLGGRLHRACTRGGFRQTTRTSTSSYVVYTNNVPAGAFRASASPKQLCDRVNINLLAGMRASTPGSSLKNRNAIRPGQVLPHGQQPTPHTNMAACLGGKGRVFQNPTPGLPSL
jgi:CO/xanthine dehydrogenase Mo-binding subunit